MDGILQPAQLGLVPMLRPEDIRERSKADIIAKMFVLSQITWFGLRVLGRLASKIPVTTIEIHTTIHAACTIVIYVMWLEKPYDVHSLQWGARSLYPTVVLLSDPAVKDMGALFNFSKLAAELPTRAYTEYERVRVSYWRDRVVHAVNNLPDHYPPPNPPIKEALTKTVQRYTLLRSNEEMTARSVMNHDEHILSELAPSALHAVEKLKQSGYAFDDAINSHS